MAIESKANKKRKKDDKEAEYGRLVRRKINHTPSPSLYRTVPSRRCTVPYRRSVPYRTVPSLCRTVHRCTVPLLCRTVAVPYRTVPSLCRSVPYRRCTVPYLYHLAPHRYSNGDTELPTLCTGLRAVPWWTCGVMPPKWSPMRCAKTEERLKGCRRR